MDESVLLKSARKLDPDALMVVFDTYASEVYRYCFRLCLDPVESDDLVGDVFSRLLEQLDSDDNLVISLRVYIFQLTYQAIVDRSGPGRQTVTIETVIRKMPNFVSARKAPKDEDQLIVKFISALNIKLNTLQRHVLLLRFLEDFSLNETALIVGKTVSNVKVIQNRALAKINQSLGLQNKPDQMGIASGVES